MFEVGQIISGYIMADNGNDVLVTGAFQFRTNDPEEYIQDIVIKTDTGRLIYIDEQEIIRK